MVEIILIYFLCKAIGNVLAQKGRTAIGYQVLAVVLWFGGEIGAAMSYGIFVAVTGGDIDTMFDINCYLASLCGAAAGAGIAYLIAHLVPPAADPLFDAPYAAPGAAGSQPYDDFDAASSNLSSAKFLQNYQNPSPNG
jgi:hypothetical protein